MKKIHFMEKYLLTLEACTEFITFTYFINLLKRNSNATTMGKCCAFAPACVEECINFNPEVVQEDF